MCFDETTSTSTTSCRRKQNCKISEEKLHQVYAFPFGRKRKEQKAECCNAVIQFPYLIMRFHASGYSGIECLELSQKLAGLSFLFLDWATWQRPSSFLLCTLLQSFPSINDDRSRLFPCTLVPFNPFTQSNVVEFQVFKFSFAGGLSFQSLDNTFVDLRSWNSKASY